MPMQSVSDGNTEVRINYSQIIREEDTRGNTIYVFEGIGGNDVLFRPRNSIIEFTSCRGEVPGSGEIKLSQAASKRLQDKVKNKAVEGGWF